MDKTFVSRGGIKLQAALDKFQVDVKDKLVLDVGSSTGGFVDCLLQNGAKKVYALDTSYGELAWKLRKDSRVVVLERTNILHFKALPELVDLITIDAGWTRLELILPQVKKFLKKPGVVVTLLKPQYEVDKRQLEKGVVPHSIADRVKREVMQKIADLQFKIDKVMESPILGGAGNKEFLLKIEL